MDESNNSARKMSMRFSVIIPIFNEEGNIPELQARLTTVMERLCKDSGDAADDFEIIMIDDGSTDGSWQLIKDLHAKDTRTTGIRFSRNFGHHIAVLAGLDRSKGEVVILMDGDLQDPPEEIPRLTEKMREGYDIVQGVASTRHINLFQELLSRAFHRLFKAISSVDLGTRLGLFRCLSRPVVESIKKLPERAVFFGGIVSWVGYRASHVTVDRSKRHAGKSKYSLSKRIALALNATASFSERPLILIFQLGLIVFVMSILIFLYTVLKKIIYDTAIIGWTSLFAAIFFSTGLITLNLSVVGLYISKLFLEVKQRPRYIIKETTG